MPAHRDIRESFFPTFVNRRMATKLGIFALVCRLVRNSPNLLFNSNCKSLFTWHLTAVYNCEFMSILFVNNLINLKKPPTGLCAALISIICTPVELDLHRRLFQAWNAITIIFLKIICRNVKH